ncbi:MAG: hypothetical protein HC897_19675 [Thermoanaerobaculia bacterium]|nr:hypothetical protein [Thermoanaerobaculia bacterium]
MLHELGHCAMALDHPERRVDISDDGFFEQTSFSASWGEASVAGSISPGFDLVRGSSDDTHEAPMGQVAENVSWFRRSDNDPFVVDSTIIDRLTFSRSVTSGLPAGHSWAANGNRSISQLLGYPETQSVMYGLLSPYQKYLGLTADDVNMVKMAQTGEDQLAGTPDDYTVELQIVGSCAEPHEVEVVISSLPLGVLGECQMPLIDFAFPQPNPALARHYKLVSGAPGQPLRIVLTTNVNWEFGSVTALFTAGFESGDTSQWSTASP